MSILRFAKTSGGSVSLITTDTTNDDLLSFPTGDATLDHLERTGNILQVVPVEYSSEVTIQSGTYTPTGLSASITPKSLASTILILINQNARIYNTSGTQIAGGIKVKRDTTDLKTITYATGIIASPYSGATLLDTMIPIMTWDNPASTSEVVYTTLGRISDTAAGGRVYFQNSSMPSTMTLIEIA